MVTIGRLGGIPTEAFVTDMDAPLGNAIGNTLEMIECFDSLKGSGTAELKVGRCCDWRLAWSFWPVLERDAHGGGGTRRGSALTSGRALQTLSRMIERAGRQPPRRRPTTDSCRRRRIARSWLASRSGFVTRMAALAIGRAAHVLGAGRSKVGEPVDHGVGAVTLAHVGEQVREGQPMIELHHRGGRGLERR